MSSISYYLIDSIFVGKFLLALQCTMGPLQGFDIHKRALWKPNSDII